MINIALGLLLVVGGLTGDLGILGSTQRAIPVAAGAAIALYGVIQVVREAKRPR